jgi:hypothetical protein
MQSAEKYTSLFHWLTQLSVRVPTSSRLPQHVRRSTRALASSAWCRRWRRALRSGLGSRDSDADRRQEWLEMLLLPKGIRWHEPHAGKQLCIGLTPCTQALIIAIYFIFCNRVLSALSLSLARVVQHLAAVKTS